MLIFFPNRLEISQRAKSFPAITLHTLTLQEPVIGDEQTKDWREDGTLDNETEDNEEQTTRHRRHKKQAVRY